MVLLLSLNKLNINNNMMFDAMSIQNLSLQVEGKKTKAKGVSKMQKIFAITASLFFLMVIGVYAQSDTTLSLVNTSIFTNNTGDLIFTYIPELNQTPNVSTDYFYGININSSVDVPNVQWKIIITFTGGITFSDVQLEEVGWYDQWGCYIKDNPTDYPNCTNTENGTYDFMQNDSNTIIALGNSGWQINNGDIFNNIDRINFAVLNPGTYHITRQLINADDGSNVSDEFTVSTFMIQTPPLPPPIPQPIPPQQGYLSPLNLQVEAPDSLILQAGETKSIMVILTASRVATSLLTVANQSGLTVFITPNEPIDLQTNVRQIYNVTIQSDSGFINSKSITLSVISGYKTFNKTVMINLQQPVLPTVELPPAEPDFIPLIFFVLLAAIIAIIIFIIWRVVLKKPLM